MRCNPNFPNNARTQDKQAIAMRYAGAFFGLADSGNDLQITDSALDLHRHMGYLVEVGANPLSRDADSGISSRLEDIYFSGITGAGDRAAENVKDGRLTAERVE